MKGRRFATLILLFALIGTGYVYAGSPWGEYKGFAKVKVYLNNSEADTGDVPGFVIDGRAVMPLRAMADSLQALLKWDGDTQTAHLYKPNVHMFVAQGIGKDDSLKTPFGKVESGNKLGFVVAAQVDSLFTAIHSFKIELEAPDGTVIRSTGPVSLDESKDSFWYSWPLKSVAFESAGTYKVRFRIKLDEQDDYTVVSEKTIIAE